MSKRTASLVICLTLAQLVAAAADSKKPIYSGPQPGEKLPPLTVEIAYGRRQQTKVDFVKQAGRKPAMLVFVNGANRPAARLTRVLVNYAEMQSRDKLFAATVWLADDRSGAQQYLKRATSWWGNGLPVGISVDGPEGPGSYGLNRNVNVTVLVAEKGKVTANFALVQPSETDAAKILAEVVKLAGGTVPTKAEVIFLSMPTRKPDNVRWTAAPADPAYRRLICKLLAAEDEQSADAAAKAVTAYVGDDADRRVQLKQIAKSLSKGRTNVGAIPAMKHLKRWRATADKAGKRPQKNTPSKYVRQKKTGASISRPFVGRALLPVTGCETGKSARPTTVNPAPVPTSDNTMRLFDFGTKTSPVVDSGIRVTDAELYNAADGYGWLGGQQRGFDRDAPLSELRHGGNPMRPDLLYKAHVTPLLQDGVASTDDISFRIDVPTGTYRMHVWLGDLHQPLESLALDCKGTRVASDISAKHIIGRAKPEATGLYQLLRFDADATDGRIVLRFHGDESEYRRKQQQYDDWFPEGSRVESFLGNGFDAKRRLKFDPGRPFERNSVLAVRVQRRSEPVFCWQGNQLQVAGEKKSGQVEFVAAVNAHDFEQAESILAKVDPSSDVRVPGYLALIGHPKVEGDDEARLLARAQTAVEAVDTSNRPGVWVVEAAQSLDIFSRARRRFHQRGMGEEGHFQENRKVVSLLRIIRPDDLLYFKSLEYQGRALQMLDPHRWVYPSGDAAAVWQELIKAFPDNRYAKYYFRDEWEPDDVWHHGDHLHGTDGAPKWAVAQREAWGLLLDVCEWWAANKQHPDGSIGGGWGDDVELVALFGLMGSISEGASEPSMRLTRRLVDGLWKYGGIDRNAGFNRGLLDAEHSAEWTGDTLPLMITIDWGNPIWIERATMTARLMQSLWMDRNDRGDLHFKSNFLGSIAIGNARQANDSYINYRAVLPVVSVYRYNRHPEIAKLLVAWADAWLADAMRTDRGKPQGVFPTEVGFPAGTLGGVNSPNWYTAAHPPGTVNYDWDRGNYRGYLVDLMLLAREITGDEKYLEPFQLQRKLVDQYRAQRVKAPRPGSAIWAAKILSEGSPRGRRPFDILWNRIEAATAPPKDDLPAVMIQQDEVFQRMDHVRKMVKKRWPVLTTETSATDRVGFRGIADPYFIMTGTRDYHPAVTYAGVDHNFAAFVKQADARYVKVVMYNFSHKQVEAAVIPWKLRTGTYQLRTGIDRDDNDAPDNKVSEKAIKLNQPGQKIHFTLAPRATTIIELRQTKPAPAREALADLAVASQEIKYSIWTRELQVVVHNIGTCPAKRISVKVFVGETSNRRKIGARTVPHLSWPENFLPQKLMIGFPYVPAESHERISVIVDAENRIPELLEKNNQATRVFEFNLAEINAPRNRVGEIGGNVSAEIQNGIR